MAVETKQLRNINFLKLMIEVESLIQAGYGINYRGTSYNGVEFRVNMVRNTDVSLSDTTSTEVSTEASADVDSKEATVETTVEALTQKSATTKKTAKAKIQADTKAPVTTTVEVKKDGE